MLTVEWPMLLEMCLQAASIPAFKRALGEDDDVRSQGCKV
jgi:hypothetical protein